MAVTDISKWTQAQRDALQAKINAEKTPQQEADIQAGLAANANALTPAQVHAHQAAQLSAEQVAAEPANNTLMYVVIFIVVLVVLAVVFRKKLPAAAQKIIPPIPIPGQS